MAVNFTPGQFNITDSSGALKFNLERRMPHILFSPKGTITVPLMFSGRTNALSIQETQSNTIITNSMISSSDYFIMPFYKITNGIADTGGKTINGSGSTLIRVIRQLVTGEILGTSILDTVVEGQSIKLNVRNNFDITNLENLNLYLNTDIAVTINYKIYYGRFS